MSQELLNTSAPRGLKPGASGFCAVAMTAGMARLLEEQLMSLSGYRWIHPAGHPDAARNPVAFAHWRVMSGGREMSVLSSVRDAGVDYSQRSNRLAHHLVIDPTEQSDAGPAWVLRQPDVVESRWDGELRTWPVGRAIPRGDNPPRPCTAWATAAGDAGWAGVLADAFLLDPSKPAYLIFAPGTEVLPLIAEAIALLPTALRWRVTFNTYFTDLPAGLICTWRCCAAGTAAANEAPRLATSGVVIDLTKSLGQAPESRSTESARTGRVEVSPFSPSPAMNPRRSMASLPNALAEETFNAPMMEATVAANATPPALRTLTPKPENDDRWMPPTRSTIVETASGGGKAGMPRGGKSRFKVFAILWPVIAMGGILGWHFRGESRGKAELRKQLTVLQSTLETQTAEITQLKGGLENKDATTSQQSTILDAAKEDAANFSRELRDTQSKLTSKAADLALANQNIVDLRKQGEKIPVLENEIAGHKTALATMQKELAKVKEKNAALSGNVPIQTIFDINSAEVVMLEFPLSTAPDTLQLEPALPNGFIVTPNGPKEIIICSQPSSSSTTKQSKNVAIVTIRLRENRVTIEHDRSRIGDQPELKNWLTLAIVSATAKGKVIGSVKLGQTAEGRFVVNDESTCASALLNAHIKVWSDQHVFGDVPAQGDWTFTFPKDASRKILRIADSKTGCSFDLTLNTLSAKIESTWRSAYKIANDDKRDGTTKLKDIPAEMKDNERNITELSRRLITLPPSSRESSDNKERIEAWERRNIKLLKDLSEWKSKLEKAEAILVALNRVLVSGDTNRPAIEIPIIDQKTSRTVLILKVQRLPIPDQKDN